MKLRFGELVLDRDTGRLLGPGGEVRLRPQAFRMLVVLAEEAPKILSQEELLNRVWGVEHLSPTSVKQAVCEVRQALGDDPVRPALIETVHRRGYRFIAKVERIEEDPPPAKKSELATQPVSIPFSIPTVAPQVRRSRRRLLATFTLPFLAGVSALALVQRPLPETSRPAVVVPAQRLARPAVAILGFKSLSADPADEWISKALAEILGFELEAGGGLQLVPAEKMARLRREVAAIAAESRSLRGLAWIGRKLDTDLVVTGFYLVTEVEGTKTLRFQMQVRDVRTGETVAWARESGGLADLTDLGAAAARGIQKTLRARAA